MEDSSIGIAGLPDDFVSQGRRRRGLCIKHAPPRPPDNQPVNTVMKRNLMKKLFGPRGIPDSDSTTLKKETKLAKSNETELGSAKPRARRTVGLTEQRLRAANKQSWMTSTKGWSDFLGRFTWSSKG